MKKKLSFLVLSLLCASAVTGCDLSKGNSASSQNSQSVASVTIVEFNVDEEKVDTVDIGTTYTVKTISAKDSEGKYHIATISVKDPTGGEVALEDNMFKCSKIGKYIITYTVEYGNSQTLSKSYTVEVTDVSAPEVTTELKEHFIATVGSEFDLSQFVVEDNSGETITPEVKVYFNGAEESEEVKDNKLTLSKEGCYVVSVVAKDSLDNTLIKDYYIHTLLDFENGYYFNNEWYATEITNSQAFDGSSAYSVDAFAGHASWFNDRSLLGDIQILDTTAKYVSFWINFENPDYETVMKAIYYDTKVYDVYGDELPPYWQGGYAFRGETWYKVVVDLTTVVNTGEAKDIPDSEPNPTTLERIPFYFGAWDLANNTNGSVPQKIFIDNIQLTNTPLEAGDFEEKPAAPESEYVPGLVTTLDYESGIYNKVKASSDGYVRDNALIDYTLAHGTYESYEPLRPNDSGSLGTLDSNQAYAENWRYFSGHNDGIVYAVEAKDHAFVKFSEDSRMEGWIDGNLIIAKYTASTQEYTEIKNIAAAKGQFGCEYQELFAGDKLFLQFKFEWEDYRNIAFPSGIEVATALKKGETIKLETPTNVTVTEGAGKFKVNFTTVSGASSYLGYIYDSTGTAVEGYDGFEIANNQELDLSSFAYGDYTIKVKAVGSDIFTDSDLSEAASFTIKEAVTISLADVKTYLKDTSNATNIAKTINGIVGGTTSENVKAGLLSGEEELNLTPNDATGWSGFVVNGEGFRVQFIEGSSADAYYYSYTASEAGYVYLTDRMASWYSGPQATVTATLGSDVVYTNTIEQLLENGSTSNAMAVYLEAGETLKVSVKLAEAGKAATISYEAINVSFYPLASEIDLPDGYTSLNDYFAA